MAASPPQEEPLVIAYYVTGHGLGHATRVAEVIRHLLLRGHTVHVATAAPAFVFWEEAEAAEQRGRLHVRAAVLDCGAVQADALTVDRRATLQRYCETAVAPREALLETEATWIRSISANLVVSDIVPIACAAATKAAIPSICVSNFSWDFIYSEYVHEAGHQFANIVFQIAEDYAQSLAIIRLPGFCPMPAFRDVIDVPLVVRPLRRTREEVRAELGIGSGTRLLLFNFGGQHADWSLKSVFLPPGWKCVVCTTRAVGTLPPNFLLPKR